MHLSKLFLLSILFVLCVVFNFPPAASHSLSAAPSTAAAVLKKGEFFHYLVSWSGIPVGSATMKIEAAAPLKPQPTLRLMTTANSNQFLSSFFPVSNRVESTVDAQSLLPLHMVFQRREGPRHDDFDITFERDEGRARVIKNGETTVQDIPPDIHDALSSLYYLRRQDLLETGSSWFMHIHHNKRNYQIEATVEGIEAIAGPWGTTSAIRVLVTTPVEGIFKNKGNIRVWLTNDQHHIPLRLNAKVTFGSINFLLQKSQIS